MRPVPAVGVDLGGTWVRVEAVDDQGRRFRSFKKPAVPVGELPLFLRTLWRRWRVRPAKLAVASRGIWTPLERADLKRGLHGQAPDIVILSDVEAAWLAAFGHQKPQDRAPEAGILVISGTGSIAYARDRDGCIKRAGGLGPFLGDEGSAFWIGRAWLRARAGTAELSAVLHVLRGSHSPVRTIAQRAMRVMRLARGGQNAARLIVHQAQDALADLVVELAASLHWRDEVPVSWAGSVLDNDWFRDGFARSVERRFRGMKRRVVWRPRAADPATAAAHFVLYE